MIYHLYQGFHYMKPFLYEISNLHEHYLREKEFIFYSLKTNLSEEELLVLYEDRWLLNQHYQN